jgi:formamidopyrimidine-DNA glycosylase
MPEGPECKHYANALNELLAGNTIYGIKIIAGRYTKAAPDGLAEDLFPIHIKKVDAKGKFIYFETADGSFIWNTLGLTGGWSLDAGKNTRIVFNTASIQLFYSDQRNFGTLKFKCSKEDTLKKLNELGLDLLGADTSSTLKNSFKIFSLKKNRDRTLAEIVMDQANYAGVGNYIKAEALYKAKLSPHRSGASLNEDDITNLHRAIHSVINDSYNSKTFALKDYESLPEPEPQVFQKVIYRRVKDPLGNEIKAEDTKDKRTTYWVPAIQI